MGRWNDHWWPPPSRPRAAKGGIRSRSRRGAFGESWWARRWIEVLEGFRIGARLQRGRGYARRGQVLDIRVEPGEVTACVQGSRARPYRVAIAIEPLSEEERRAAAGALARRPRLAATLLAGEMPRELEEAFDEAGVPLFPRRSSDLATECSCPDWSNPCKHIAAVYYLVAEEFDRNPFFVLRLRGFARGDLVEASPEGVGDEAPSDAPGEAPAGGSGEAEPRAPERPRRTGSRKGEKEAGLPSDPRLFWEGGESGGDAPAPEGEEGAEGADSLGPGGGAPHLRALDRIPFWRGESDPTKLLAGMIERAGPMGVEVLAGGEGAGAAETGPG